MGRDGWWYLYGCDLDRDLGNRGNDVKGKKMMLKYLVYCQWSEIMTVIDNAHLLGVKYSSCLISGSWNVDELLQCHW